MCNRTQDSWASGPGRFEDLTAHLGNRTRTVAEDASLADREKVWFQMVESLSRNVDKVLEEQIRKHMTAYLR